MQKYNIDRILELEVLLRENNIELQYVLGKTDEEYTKFKETGAISNSDKSYLNKHVLNLKDVDLKGENKLNKDGVVIQQRNKKIHHLNNWLKETKGVELYKAISISKEKLDDILKGLLFPTNSLTKRIANYFFFDQSLLLNDSLALPKDEDLRVDDDLVAVQRKEVSDTFEYYKSRNFIKRNYRVLDKKQRRKLSFSLLLNSIALVVFPLVCLTAVGVDKKNVNEQFTNNNYSSLESDYAVRANKVDKSAQSLVKTGANVYYVKNISPSSSSYEVKLKLFFDFNQYEFYKSYLSFAYNEDYTIPNSESYFKSDYYSYIDGAFVLGNDNVPDALQISNYDSAAQSGTVDPTLLIVNQKWIQASKHYPGEISSDNFPEKEDLFEVLNADIQALSFAYNLNSAYSLTNTSTSDVEYRYVQAMTFNIVVHKLFKSCRYPLESIQLRIDVKANNMSSKYICYELCENVNVSSHQADNIVCSMDSSILDCGKNSNFYVAGGYEIIDGQNTKLTQEETLKTKDKYGFVQRITYLPCDNDKINYSSAYTIFMRINRTGVNTFLKAYLNLVAVVIWIVIAFFAQAYQNENALGMLGSGLFAAISSIIVGLNMISDVGLFSLITMVNVFALYIILIMAYQSIMARNAQVKHDKRAIAYMGVKLRILFIVITFACIAMFGLLPLVAFTF